MNALYHLGKGFGQFCFNAFGRLEVIGKESIPPYGPLLVVANHLSFNDPPVPLHSDTMIPFGNVRTVIYDSPARRRFIASGQAAL